jgi:hypothetical protein
MIAANLFDAIGVVPSLSRGTMQRKTRHLRRRRTRRRSGRRRPAPRSSLIAVRAVRGRRPCRQYFDSLPRRKRLLGVVAGQVHQPARQGRPRKVPAS